MAHACRELGIRYALSAFSSAARVAPFVRYHRITAYVDRDVAELAKRLKLKQVTSGENVTLLIPYDLGVFYDSREIEGVLIASPIQIYLDLMASPGRGEEAAGFLYEKEIIPGGKRTNRLQRPGNAGHTQCIARSDSPVERFRSLDSHPGRDMEAVKMCRVANVMRPYLEAVV